MPQKQRLRWFLLFFGTRWLPRFLTDRIRHGASKLQLLQHLQCPLRLLALLAGADRARVPSGTTLSALHEWASHDPAACKV